MVSLIIALILVLLLGALGIFYLDLANGPLVWLIVWCIALGAFILIRLVLAKKGKRWFRLFPWLGIFVVAVICVNFAKPAVEVKASGGDKSSPTTALTIDGGQIRGLYSKDKAVAIYTGIPYAAPPIGENRWKAPQDVTPWTGVKDCFDFAAKSYQPDSNPVMNSLVDIYAQKSWHPDFTSYPEQNKSEDSLYLNVWAPKAASNAPVLVYYHGGSLTSGSSASDDINGESFARKGVIMVTVGYRLGVFGYFAHADLLKEGGTTGNYGLLDQAKALKWVHENIAAFGGDPSKVTIAGESAGSSSVSALCVSPLARDPSTDESYFRYAIGESSSLIVNHGAPHTYRTLEEAEKTGAKIMAEMGCNSIDELRKVPAEKLVKTKYANSSMCVDGYALKEEPYLTYANHKQNETKLLNGFNVKEADAFVIPTYLFSPTNIGNIKERLIATFDEDTANRIMTVYKDKIEADAFNAFNEIFSVYWFLYPHYSWSNAALDAGETVYRYQFTKENGYYGTYHAGEIAYAYGNLSRSPRQFAYNQSDYALSEKMVDYWTSFVKTGNPGSNWVAYQGKDDAKPLMELGENVSMIKERYTSLYPIIEEWNAKPKKPAKEA